MFWWWRVHDVLTGQSEDKRTYRKIPRVNGKSIGECRSFWLCFSFGFAIAVRAAAAASMHLKSTILLHPFILFYFSRVLGQRGLNVVVLSAFWSANPLKLRVCVAGHRTQLHCSPRYLTHDACHMTTSLRCGRCVTGARDAPIVSAACCYLLGDPTVY